MAESGSQGLYLEQKQRLRLSQQQLRFVKLLELNTRELEEAVDKELDDNPALQAEYTPESAPMPDTRQNDDTPYYRLHANNYSADDNTPEFSPTDSEETLYDYLDSQIAERDLPEKVEQMAHYLVGNMDANGYIRRPLRNILDDLEFIHGVSVNEKDAENALIIIRSLDPSGVGAYDLRDCLKLQLERKPASPVRDRALEILNSQFEAFSMKHYHKIMSALEIDKDRTMEAVDLIRSLNPKPGSAFSNTADDLGNIIVPDLIVENHEGKLVISMNSSIPDLSIEQSFEEAAANLKQHRATRKAALKENEYIMNRYNEARDFINILKRRQQTVLDVMTAITQIQKDYFLTEDVALMKPMMIKDISNLTGLDLSTVSRATANKYVGTSWGVFPLRHFFSDTIGNEEDGLTNRRIEAEISAMVEKEDKKHPLSDEKICRALNEKGFDVSRRTVAKYRDRKGIPVARLRKEM